MDFKRISDQKARLRALQYQLKQHTQRLKRVVTKLETKTEIAYRREIEIMNAILVANECLDRRRKNLAYFLATHTKSIWSCKFGVFYEYAEIWELTKRGLIG